MKKLALFLLTVVTVIALVSCTPNTSSQDDQNDANNMQIAKNPGCSQILDKVIEELSVNTEDFEIYNFADQEHSLDQSTISLFYGDLESEPDFSNVTDYCLMVPVTTTATEIGVFKVENQSDANQFEKYFSNRTNSRATTFANYNQAEAQKANDAVISHYGQYVWYIVTDTNDQVQEIILQQVK